MVQKDATKLNEALETEMKEKKQLKDKIEELEAASDKLKIQIADLQKAKEKMAESIGGKWSLQNWWEDSKFWGSPLQDKWVHVICIHVHVQY